MTQDTEEQERPIEARLKQAVIGNVNDVSAAFVAAAVLREAKTLDMPGHRWARLRDNLPGLTPPPGLVAAGFGALLVITPIAISKWPGNGTSFDRTVLAMATGDPLGVDPGFSVLLRGNAAPRRTQ